ncbi:hypothetical protein Nepgr_010706 [Nepenthes gracilis]|uniref:Uncharacterized protein n=1 Tax=Nepenthes gracilis TaxID=150966 RepID=A0AAD3XLN8_NEPGR|nr:hypothetical protein Nepgr_010706 [Nepenthes gracilis]
MLESDCFMALKMALLLPYEAIQLHCLDAVDGKLRQEGITDARRNDRDFLIVVLSSGVVATIVHKSSSFGATFCYLSYLVGNFLHQCQDAELSRLDRGEKGACGNDDEEFFLLFRRILFPCFVSELVKVDQQILAGFLVMKFMHTHAALSLINVAEASLHRYLKMMLQVLPGESSVADEVKATEVFGNTLSSLTGKLKGLVHSALSSLPSINS